MNLANLKIHTLFLLFIAVFALIRVYISPLVGLGVDEAHYVLYGLNLDLSYFDHPPLVGWIEYLSSKFLGINELSARVPAIIIGFLTSIFLYRLLYSINNSYGSAFVGVLALYASFIFNALFIMLLPDTLLFLLIIPTIFATIYVVNNSNIFSWILLSILLGLAGLSKYTAILFIVPILLFVIFKKRYELFISSKILITIFIALLIISPVIIWNIQNDWISFTYQSNHVVGSSEINWNGFFRSLIAQFVAYNPFLMPLAFYGLFKAFRSDKDEIFLSALFGAVLILFFIYASLYKTALPHWSALFYMLFIPIGITYLVNSSVKYVKYSIIFGIVISLFAYSELAYKFIPQPDFKSIHRDLYGWDKIMQKADQVGIKNIAVTNWTLASRAMFYNNDYNSTVYVLDKRFDQFDMWNDPKKLLNKDILIINTHEFHKDLKNYVNCSSLETKDRLDLKLNNHFVNSVDFVECKNYQGLK